MNKNLPFYVITLMVFGALLWLVLSRGKALEHSIKNSNGQTIEIQQQVTDAPIFSTTAFITQMTAALKHPLSVLILQIIAIIVFSRIIGFLFSKIGQPTV